MNVGEVVCGL